MVPPGLLCHNSVDKPFVRKLAKRFTRIGLYVWLDEAVLDIGDSLIERISAAIHDVDYVVAVISANSIGSRWVGKELSYALTHEINGKQVKVLPILFEQCELPVFLQDKLYADFTEAKSFRRQFERLLKAMGLAGARSVTWTAEGPQIIGDGVIISATESSALLDRWSEWLHTLPLKCINIGPR